jgi:hypothetical protein
MEAGLKVTVVPAGAPEDESEIAELNPPKIVVDAVTVPELPWAIDFDVGETEIAKSGTAAAVTVNVTVAVCVTPPPVPVAVMGYVPVAVAAPTEMVIVEDPEPGAAMEAGLKLTVAPDGAPDAERETAELNPPETVVEIVLVPDPPWMTETAAGEADIVKSGVPPPTAKIRSSWSSYAPVLQDEALPV